MKIETPRFRYLAWPFVFAVFGCLLVWLFGLRSNHPDNIIAMEVVNGMLSQGSLSTNWINYDLNDFKYNQTNFSGFHYWLFYAASLLQIDQLSTDNFHSAVRILLAGYFTLVAFFRWLSFPKQHLQNALCLILAIFNFQIWQDAAYIRPETFVLFFFTLSILFVFSDRKWLILLGAFSYGVLFATKFSFAMLAPFYLGAALFVTRDWKYVAGAVVCFLLANLLFNWTAFSEFSAYLNGIDFLMNQYGNGFYPHGLPEEGPVDRLLYVLHYQFSTNFGLIPVGLVVGFLVKDARVRVFNLGLLLVFVYFSIKPIYFERNITFLGAWSALTIPLVLDTYRGLFVRIAVVGFALIASALSVFNFVFLDRAISSNAELFHHDLERISNKYGLPVRFSGILATFDGFKKEVQENQGIILAVADSGHPQFKENMENIFIEFPYLEVVERVNSYFQHVPSSTLHVYHSSNIYFIKDSRVVGFDCDESETCLGKYWVSQGVGRVIDVVGYSEGADFNRSNISPLKVYGSVITGDADTANFELVFDAAPVFAYKAGPVTDNQHISIRSDEGDSFEPDLVTRDVWTVVKAAEHLPASEKYIVSVHDEGTDWGEWIAVAALPPEE